MKPTIIPLLVCASCVTARPDDGAPRSFDPARDALSLHYDHADDPDDGHSAAADRTLLEVVYGADWVAEHVLPVSGAYGKNAGIFNPDSDAVMDAAWNDCGGWLAAHDNREAVLVELVARWSGVLERGGDVWVKEGGQSDLTADVVKRIRIQSPEIATPTRIHVVQHSNWNEDQTTEAALAYTKEHTHYLRIRDANAYLNVEGGDEVFIRSATGHPVFGAAWRAAFAYYDPNVRLDFSDTGELMFVLGLGELGFDEFRERYLEVELTP